MIAIVKVRGLVGEGKYARTETWWEPLTFAWERDAERAVMPVHRWACVCGVRFAATTGPALRALLAAHEAKSAGCGR